ncbi:DEAD/DEAH box helicase [Vulcanococcus limneticus]|uniref:DEAD/DEAH box helicase n=1 Tax=Vulcanococcus limneticus TaxID=2170428 RepID=UPI00398C1E04
MAAPSFDLGPRPGGAGGRGNSGPGGDTTIRPRQWQSQLIQLLRRRLEGTPPSAAASSTASGQGPGQDVLIHAGPGAGKTLGALLGFQRLQAEGRLQHFVVFCHRSSIAGQWRAAAARLGLRLAEWEPELSTGRGPWVDGSHGLLLTYQGAGRNLEQLEQQLTASEALNWLAIADEVHHLGVDPEEPEATAWGHAFSRLSASASLRLGLTGTPFRADNLGFCAARRVQVFDEGVWVEQIAPDLSVEPRQLIAAGDVRPLEFRFQDGWVDHGRQGQAFEDGSGDGPGAAAPVGDTERSPLSLEQRESWRARNLRRAIRLGDSSSIALRLLLNARRRLESVRRQHPEAGGLVIARDIAHARRISGLLEEEGDRVHLVHSQDPDAQARLAAFQGGEADWLVSVDMCAEGFDAARLRVVAYLTTVVTRTRFVQAITRAVRMDDSRAALEAVPRHPSYVFAPADPLLMRYARSWSLSEPYLIRPKAAALPPEPAAGGRAPTLPLQAVEDGAGEVIRVKGPQLPSFLSRPSARETRGQRGSATR